MATSLSYNFQMTRSEITRHALDLVGAVPLGGDPRPEQTARAARALNLVLQSLQLEGLRLWAREIDNRLAITAGGSTSTTLTSGTSTYYLPPDTLEVMADGVILRNTTTSIDTQLVAQSIEDYQKLGNKSVSGVPSQFVVEWNVSSTDTVTLQGGLKMTVWPVPNASTYSIRYVRTRKLADFDGQTNDPDTPARWMRLLVYGLAVELAHQSGLAIAERQMLKAEYESEKQRVLHDDTPRGNIVLVPEIPWVRY